MTFVGPGDLYYLSLSTFRADKVSLIYQQAAIWFIPIQIKYMMRGLENGKILLDG